MEFRIGLKTDLQLSESVFQCEFFVKQSGEKPVWKIVKPYMGTDAKFVSAVVPWFEILSGKQFSGCIFAEKNKQSIDGTAEREPQFMGDTKQRAQKSSAAVNGKHP